MDEHPYYIRMPAEDEVALFGRHSCTEVVISTVIQAQASGWMQLHGFVVLPETLEMVATPVRLGVSALVAYIQSETIPLLSVLIPHVGMIWSRHFMRTPLETQRALDARLKMLLLSPVAQGLVESASDYAYSSANSRFSGFISAYEGFANKTSAKKAQSSDAPSGNMPNGTTNDGKTAQTP